MSETQSATPANAETKSTAPRAILRLWLRTLAILLIVSAITGAALAAWASHRHVIVTEHGTLILPKRFITFRDTYVDTRAWNTTEFQAHQAVRDALIRAGYRDILREARAREFRQDARELAANLQTSLRDAQARVGEWVSYWRE